jgi:hypothetical protein
MVTMFIRHEVADYAKWRQAYDGFDAERRGMGVVSHAVYRSAERDVDITVIHDFESLASARSFLASQRLREVMGAAGGVSVPTIWLTTRV